MLGHKDARSPLCKMKHVNVRERESIEKIIYKETIERQVAITSDLRKFICSKIEMIFFM